MHQAATWEDVAAWQAFSPSWHFDTATHGAYGRSTRKRSTHVRGAAAHDLEVVSGLGLAVLTSDPLVEKVYRAGLVSLRDLRALVGCTRSEAIQLVAQERARLQLCTAAAELRGLRAAFEACAARVRVLGLDAEARLLQLGVPMNAVHPELSTPLKQGGASHHALYAGLLPLSQVLRAATHPAAWAEPSGCVWGALAKSAGFSMRPQLVLLLSSLLPVEARMSYVALRHEAYSRGHPGVYDLGGLVKSVLLRMMLRAYGPLDARRLTKHLRQAAPRLSPFSFWLLRRCAAGSAPPGLTLAQRQQQRVEDEEWLSARIDELFAERQEQVLYNGDAWVPWLHALPTRFLVAFYIKYVQDSWQ